MPYRLCKARKDVFAQDNMCLQAIISDINESETSYGSLSFQIVQIIKRNCLDLLYGSVVCVRSKGIPTPTSFLARILNIYVVLWLRFSISISSSVIRN